MRTYRLATIMLGTIIPFTAVEAAAQTYWNIPTNVRLVQKSGTNARTFTSVQAAINNCATKMGVTLTATNRCLVKVMPGSYTGTVVMKSFVDVEGSGSDTILTSTAPIGVDFWSSTPVAAATVKMAADSEIRNLTIRNTSPTGGVALLFDNVAARAMNLTVEATGSCVDGTGECDFGGVVSQGLAAVATLDSVNASAANTNTAAPAGQSIAIASLRGARIKAHGCSARGYGGEYRFGIYCLTGTDGSIDLSDSTVEVDGSGNPIISEDATCALTIRDSVVRVTTCVPGVKADWAALNSVGLLTVANSEFWDCACGIASNSSSPLLKVSGSLIDQRAGGCNYGSGARIAHCWDSDSKAIPNQ